MKNNKGLHAFATLLGAGALLTSSVAHAVGNGHFEFGIWGDMPYAKSNDSPKIPALIANINALPALAFSIYDGDTKDGSSVCDDVTIGSNAITMFNQLRAPLIYVPGDNEWTDCHRKNNGGYNALERLSFIRLNLFNTANSFGQHTMALEHQGALGDAYSENTRWTSTISIGIEFGFANTECQYGTGTQNLAHSNRSLRPRKTCAQNAPASIARHIAELAFNTDELVVLGKTVRAAQ